MVTELIWPPTTAEEMIAWQKVCGIDRDIARAVGRTRSTVQQTRKDLGVGPVSYSRHKQNLPVSEPGRPPDVVPKDRGNESQIYAGRRYEDIENVEPEGAGAGRKGILE